LRGNARGHVDAYLYLLTYKMTDSISAGIFDHRF